MDETPLPFDNRSAKDYRTMGEKFRYRIKVEKNKIGQVTIIKGSSKDNMHKNTENSMLK